MEGIGAMDLQMFSQEKTEAPTPKRREDARKKGQVARSPEVGSAALLLVLGIGFKVIGPKAVERMWRLAVSFWGAGPSAVTTDGVSSLVATVIAEYASMMLPVFAVAIVVGTSAGVVQGGFVFSSVPLKPQLNRLNPLEGMKRIVSKKALVEMVKSLLKTITVSVVGYLTIRGELPGLLVLAESNLLSGVSLVTDVAFRVLWRSGLALLAIAGADYAFQYWEHERSLLMTRQELKEEMKQVEGRPEVRSKIRERQRAITRLRMMAEVARADVVVTNPTHYAVALRYDALRMAAPRVVAKGEGTLADRIRNEADKHAVTIVRNAPLAQGLYRSVAIGQYVPAEFYKAVAEVLAFVYRLKGRV